MRAPGELHVPEPVETVWSSLARGARSVATRLGRRLSPRGRLHRVPLDDATLAALDPQAAPGSSAERADARGGLDDPGLHDLVAERLRADQEGARGEDLADGPVVEPGAAADDEDAPIGRGVDQRVDRGVDRGVDDERDAPDAGPPTPLDETRIVTWLTEQGYPFFVDSEGQVGGMLRGRVFYFLVFGEDDEILQVHGQWNRDVSIDRIGDFLEACNEWNAERIWPKAYVRVRDNGVVQVFTELTVDLEHGVNDAQLGDLLMGGLGTATAFFDALDDAYPDPLRSAA